MSIIRSFKNVNKLQSVQYFHTNTTYNNNLNKVMKKILVGSAKRKNFYNDSPTLPTPVTFSKGSHEGKKSGNSKRATVLNKLFMRYITDLMTTGECSLEFAGYNIEINRVQITPDYKFVNVYWVAKGTENDLIIENLLQANSGILRHELSQLKVMGMVPRIKFIKDKQYALTMEVALRLAKADFGDDYKPVDHISLLKTQLEINTKIPPKLKEKIEEVDNKITYDEEEIPPMPQNVLGLNHSEIMEKVKNSIKKACAVRRLDAKSDENQIPKTLNSNPFEYPDAKTQREVFKQFLAKRQILKNKLQRKEKNLNLELDYLQEEWDRMREEMQSREQMQMHDFEYFFNESDFVEEDEDVK